MNQLLIGHKIKLSNSIASYYSNFFYNCLLTDFHMHLCYRSSFAISIFSKGTKESQRSNVLSDSRIIKQFNDLALQMIRVVPEERFGSANTGHALLSRSLASRRRRALPRVNRKSVSAPRK